MRWITGGRAWTLSIPGQGEPSSAGANNPDIRAATVPETGRIRARFRTIQGLSKDLPAGQTTGVHHPARRGGGVAVSTSEFSFLLLSLSQLGMSFQPILHHVRGVAEEVRIVIVVSKPEVAFQAEQRAHLFRFVTMIDA